MESVQLVHNWNRSVTMLGDPRSEGEIQQALAREYPTDAFPFHIDVVGGHSLKDRIAIRLWNNHDVDMTGRVDLADSAKANKLEGELLWAVMSKVAQSIESLKQAPAEVKQQPQVIERRSTERRRSRTRRP